MLHLLEITLKFTAFILLGLLFGFMLMAMAGLSQSFMNFLPIIWEVLWRIILGLLFFGLVVSISEAI
jgi:hypothetical protein